MSEAGFDRIEQQLLRLDAHVQSGFTELRTGITELRTGLADVRSDIARVDQTMHALHDVALERIQEVDRNMHLLHDTAMERIGQVDQHMRVLHETAMDAIRGISEHDLVTRPELDRRLAEERETTDRRLDPLEAIVRRMNAPGPKRRPS